MDDEKEVAFEEEDSEKEPVVDRESSGDEVPVREDTEQSLEANTSLQIGGTPQIEIGSANSSGGGALNWVLLFLISCVGTRAWRR